MEIKRLYHYCSLNTIISILEKRTIKLSEIQKSNDRKEIEFLWDCYISYISRVCGNALCSQLEKYDKEKQMAQTNFLAVCFSEHSDSQQMWSNYGNGGVCIGFNKEKLEKWADGIHVFDNGIVYTRGGHYGQAKLGKVRYFCKKALYGYINNHIAASDNSFKHVFNNAPFIKSKSWSGEKEWRVSIPLIYDHIYSNYIIQVAKKANVCIPRKEKMLVRLKDNFSLYLSCFVPFEPDMIESITLAPNCKANEIDIKKMLLIYKFGFLIDEIKRSKCGMR